ncbi:hypothetical protein [Emticicia soli]|uniref:XRE family transcriptional regulator n=1 Tax=Emticicia soli TaxID=2027878 RepID=A0ABW5J5T9_9BACT
MKAKKFKAVLRWNKQMIAEMLGVDVSDLNYFVSEETRVAVEWQKGKQSFNDKQVFTIIKDFRRLATDEQILMIIYPKGIK